MWGILAFFAYDNILEWMRHPIVMLLIMMIFVALGYMFATGKIYILMNFY